MGASVNWQDCQSLEILVCGNIGFMTSRPTPEQIAKMDADQLRTLLLSQIEANSKLQAKVVEVQ